MVGTRPPGRLLTLLGGALALLGCAVGGDAPPPPPNPSPPDALTVRVIGEHYGWRVVFPGPDGRFETADDGISGPDFHLPAGVSIRLEVTSHDYLYLLKVPRFAIKVMAVPEMTMTAVVRIEEPATGELTGDPMCGFQHGDLTGRVTVESWEDFYRWQGSL